MTSFENPYVNALKEFYNNVGKAYNNMTQSIHAGGPERLVEAAGVAIKEGSSVLDLATGTGKVAFAAACKVGPEGRVLGIDISDGFLDVATKVAEELGVGDRVEFLQRDVADLNLPEKYKGRWADAVTCGNAVAMFPSPKSMLHILAKEMLKPGGVFVADMWGPHLPANIFLDVAVPRGFEAPFDPIWLSDTEEAFRKVLEGTKFELQRVAKEGQSLARWDVGSDEKIEALWKSLTVEQTWLSFGLGKLSEEKVEETKRAWVEELQGYKNEEGIVVVEMKQRIAVAVVRE